MNDNNSELLVLVDGSSYLYRALHALPNLGTSSGQPTGAVYGVINMVRRLLADYAPQYMAVVFDAKGKTFRHDLFPQYKANRPPMPVELRSQIPYVHDLMHALGIPLISVPGVEADDVIATLAARAADAGLDTLVSTGDKDLAQIVTDRVSLVDTMQDKRYDIEGVIGKFGVPPQRIVDYLALVGDTSDNIPGVPKVGPKTAVKWLKEYGSLDDLVVHAEEIKGKVGENLRASLEQLPLSRELATVKDGLDLEVAPRDLVRGAPDNTTLRKLFTELEFSSWLSEIADADNSGADQVPVDYTTILDAASLEDWVKRLRKAGCFVFDTETTSLDAVSADLVGVSFAIETHHAAYVPCGHDYPDAPQQLSREHVLKALKPLLEDPGIVKIGQNLKYDHCVLQGYGIELNGIGYDTMLESYVLDSVANRHDMDSLALKYLGHKTITYADVAGKGKSQMAFNAVPLEQAATYAAEDADITLRLHHVLWPKLEQQPRLRELFEKIEMPLLTTLSRVERNGVRIDSGMLREQSKEFAAGIKTLETRAQEVAGMAFNIASPKQIQEVLYDRLELPVLRKTPKGQPSTAENVLQQLAVDYELPQLILDHRALSKLKSTYTDKLPEMVNPRTGRVHTSYHQAVAATGRLSSSDPNLQNIPIRSSEGRRIREAFIPSPGNLLLAADYSQIELRIMAHLSQDPGLLEAFAEGADVHRATAAEVFGVPPDAVTADQRRHAKAINFGLIYGMSAFGLAQQLKIQRGEAQDYINVYFARYPGVKEFMDNTRARAHENGFVETVFGRRLYLPDIGSTNHPRRQYAERTAINAPMQGTAADIIKMAMLVIDDWLRKERNGVVMIMQVHDELVFEVPEGAVDPVASRIEEMMSGVAELSVPLTLDIGTGQNWALTHA